MQGAGTAGPATNTATSSRTWLYLLMAAFVVALVVVLIVLGVAAHNDVKAGNTAAAHQNERWIGHVGALTILALFTGSLFAFHAGRFLNNEQGRLSTSKLQAFLWTYAIAFALLSIMLANFVGAPASWDAFLKEGLKEEYLILLGGPFAAAVLSRLIVGTKLASGELSAPSASAPSGGAASRLGEAVTDSEGNSSLVDIQYLLFNLVALVYFIGAFFTEAGDGFPEIPDTLVALTGASAATYVGNKATLKYAPALINLTPALGPVNTPVTIFGRNLLTPKAGSTTEFEDVHVRFGGVPALVDPTKIAVHDATGDDRLYVTVPPGVSGAVKVDVITFRGMGTAQLDFEVKP